MGFSVDGSPSKPSDISFFLSAERREAFQNDKPIRISRAAGRPYMNQRAIRIDESSGSALWRRYREKSIAFGGATLGCLVP
jgi:hypothetical protein